MTGGVRLPELRVPAAGRQPALILRPWRAADIPALTAEMSREYPVGGMWPGPGERPVRTALPGGTQGRAGRRARRGPVAREPGPRLARRRPAELRRTRGRR